MNIVTNLSEWHAIRKTLQAQTIGFVPTMGNLHAGHLSLCKQARAENSCVVASLFVNPTQFNQPTDFALYPRTVEQDKELLLTEKVDYLFLPEEKTLYPDDYELQVTETVLSHELEGAYRPGHFKGMLTVVLKLLNLVQPTRAYFGEKDYQQLLLIKKMVSAFFVPVEIIPCKTVRADDGLALSSRNTRLTAEQRKKAPAFSRLLHSDQQPDVIVEQLQALGFKVDYIAEQWQRRLGAVWLDDVRLIDNVPLNS